MLKLFTARFRNRIESLRGRKDTMGTAAIQSDTAWLRIPDYEVAALNPKLSGRVWELKHALSVGLPACPDTSRGNFYDVELPNGWAYIHVRDDKQMVYLIAYSRMQFGNAG
jgi:hypothetical protein